MIWSCFMSKTNKYSLFTLLSIFASCLYLPVVLVFQFELDGQGGVVLSLYSVILCRKVDG